MIFRFTLPQFFISVKLQDLISCLSCTKLCAEPDTHPVFCFTFIIEQRYDKVLNFQNLFFLFSYIIYYIQKVVFCCFCFLFHKDKTKISNCKIYFEFIFILICNIPSSGKTATTKNFFLLWHRFQ